MLHVVEEERRKGLAQALIQKYCWNFVNEFNLDPTTIILTSNSQSRALFHKMGFEEIDEINIYCIKN